MCICVFVVVDVVEVEVQIWGKLELRKDTDIVTDGELFFLIFFQSLAYT